MEEIMYWIWLSRIPGIGARRIKKVLQKEKDPKKIWKMSEKQLKQQYGIGEILAERISSSYYKKGLEKYCEYMKEHDIDFISIIDKRYPNNLRQIYDPPIGLYIKGNQENLHHFGLAIVGSRIPTQYGEKIAKKLAFSLAKQHINIISGLARGIDTCAHIGCLKATGKTIAILGNGLDSIYPSENRKIVENVLQFGGALLSEYPIGTKPEKMNFPARNRIISGLSNGVIVIEARKKSGSMITVDFALQEGKNVFAVPGNIDNQNSEGTNGIIQEGAKLITKVEDILEEYR